MVGISSTVTDEYRIKVENAKISVREGAIFRTSLNVRPVGIMPSTVYM